MKFHLYYFTIRVNVSNLIFDFDIILFSASKGDSLQADPQGPQADRRPQPLGHVDLGTREGPQGPVSPGFSAFLPR